MVRPLNSAKEKKDSAEIESSLVGYNLNECMASLGDVKIERFPRAVFQQSSDLKLYFSFLSTTSCSKRIRTPKKKTLSLLMALKGGDCIRKEEVRIC